MDNAKIWDQQQSLMQNGWPIIIDAGANEGQSVKEYRGWWPDATIHCFEPDPRAFKALRDEWGRSVGVHLYSTALGAIEGRTQFNLGSASYASSILSNIPDYIGQVPLVESTEVPITTIDAFLTYTRLPYVNILKMDLQGFELEALKGTKDALKEEVIDIIYTEIHLVSAYLGAPQYWQIAQYLNDFGYKTWNIEIMHYGSDIEGRWGDAIFLSDRYAKRLGY